MSTELGNTWKVTVPSGKIWEIRETNGEDESNLSRVADAMNEENLNNFLANIIVGPERPLAADILNWPINDKYYLMFKQRILNLGAEFQFKDTDTTDRKKREVEYTEDLGIIDGDLSDPEYRPGPNQIFRYPEGDKTHIEFKTTFNNFYRFKILTGVEEQAAADIPKGQTDKNTPIVIRQLERHHNNKWERVYNFLKISSKEMVEIRAAIQKYDREFNPLISVTNPWTGADRSFPLFALPTFYFPGE